MVAVVIVTHGNLAQALLDAAHTIVGELPATQAVGLEPSDGPEQAQSKVEAAMEAVDEGNGTLFLVDLPGGTPCSICVGCISGHDAEVVTGVNLSMLVKLPFIRAADERSLHERAEQIAALGKRSIRVVTDPCCNEPPKRKE